MPERFVYIRDDFQEWIRVRSRESPLVVHHRNDKWYEGKRGTPLYVIHDTKQLRGAENDHKLPNRFDHASPGYVELKNQTISAEESGEFRENVYRSRTIHATFSNDLVAEELLAFGAGLLRKVYTRDQLEEMAIVAERFGTHKTLSELLGLEQVPPGKLDSRRLKIYGHILLYCAPNSDFTIPQPWESTNIILGDAYGELEQLRRRRAETEFLDQIARIMSVSLKPWTTDDVGAISSQTLTNEEYVLLAKAHLQMQGLWPSPPNSGQELTERVDYILSHTDIDERGDRRIRIDPRRNIKKVA